MQSAGGIYNYKVVAVLFCMVYALLCNFNRADLISQTEYRYVYLLEKVWNSANMVVTKVSDLSLALESGQIDALVLDQAVAESLIAAYSDMTILDGIDFDDAGSFGIAVSKTNTSEFLSLVNSVIRDSKADGSLTSLYQSAVEKANA